MARAYAAPHSRFAPAQIVQRNLPKGPNRGIVGPAVQTALLGSRGVVRRVDRLSGQAVALWSDPIPPGIAAIPVRFSARPTPG